MDAEKLGSLESSSEEEETDQPEEESPGANAKRSYECTFCRRGFTNAQALGGHMNIHRKDRAKGKQITPNSSIPRKFSKEEHLNSPYISEFSSQPSSYFSILEAQRNYNMYFQPPVPPPPNPRQPPSYAFGYEFINQRAQSFNMNQELLGANLSLRIGPSHVEATEVMRGIQKDDEVDLELRLGHDPY